MSNSWGSYPSIFAMGHRAIRDLLTVDVNVEEKVDGSQFSFGLVEPNLDPEGKVVDATFEDTKLSLKTRSKGAVMYVDAPEAMFKSACATVLRLAHERLLHPGWTYRGEVLSKPHHNALTYERVPVGNIIIYDVNIGHQDYLSYEDKATECERIGLECVPRLYVGHIKDINDFRNLLGNTSILGGQQIEGVVVKPTLYNLYGEDKKVLMAKFVSEAFKEVHRKTWGESNPSNKDIIGLITQTYRTAARWQKALLHLRERGLIHDVVQDIGLIIREVPDDVFAECEEEMKDMLWKHAKKHIQRGLTSGLPLWYKDQLLRLQFEKDATIVTKVEEPKA